MGDGYTLMRVPVRMVAEVQAIIKGTARAVPVASDATKGEPRGCPTPGACSCVARDKP